MRGQYRILSEILIFAVGMAITTYVAVSFSEVRDFIGSVSTADKMETTANTIINSIARASMDSSLITMEIPEKISGREYSVRVQDRDRHECDKGDTCYINLSMPDVSISKEFFNISKEYDIKGDVYSTARFLSISSDKGSGLITVGRA